MDKVWRLCYDLDDMQSIEIITNSPKETKKVAILLSEAMKDQSLSNRAFIIALEGDLGSGKTTFIQGLAQGLKVGENILSPTFVIQKDFSLELKNFKNLYHFDAYRLKNPEELLELGFRDLIRNPENLIVIEWADKIKKLLPREILRIKFVSLREISRREKNWGGNKRRIIISEHAGRARKARE